MSRRFSFSTALVQVREADRTRVLQCHEQCHEHGVQGSSRLGSVWQRMHPEPHAVQISH